MEDFTRPIAYLEDFDFDNEGTLINDEVPKDKPVVIMLQASWCPHCTVAKPAFQDFANKNKDTVFCATIQADGERESEKQLGKKINTLKENFRGFPDYLLYYKGVNTNKEIRGRSVEDLKNFSNV